MGDVGVSSEVDEWIYNFNKMPVRFYAVKIDFLNYCSKKSWAGVGPMKRLGVGCPTRVLWYFSILMTSHRTLFMGYFERK